jgi:PAS domain S-box-containing protein
LHVIAPEAAMANMNSRTSWFTLALPVLIAFTAWAGLTSGLDAVRQATELERVNSDNIPWNLSQLEVEYLRYLVALDTYAMHAPTRSVPGIPGNETAERLAEMRLRFDIFYSRIATITESPLFGPMRDYEQLANELEALATFADLTAEVMDSEPETIAADARSLEVISHAQGETVREIATTGVAVLAEQSSARRLDMRESLWQMALATLTSSLLLLLSVVRIWKTQIRARADADMKHGIAKRLQAIISTSPVPIIIADENMKIVEFNQASEQVFGYTRAEALANDVGTLLVPPDLRDRHYAGVRRHKSTGDKTIIGKSGVKIRALRSDGSEIPAEIALSEGKDSSGKFYVAFLRDISAQEEHEQELREARDSALAGEKAKERILAVVSHEMRTPLQGIMGALELIQSKRPTKWQKSYLDILERSSRRLLRHIDDLLSVARSDQSQIAIEPRKVDLRAMLGDLRRGHLPAAAENGNDIVIANYTLEDPVIATDPIRLTQIFDNLISNAIKFTSNGRIELGCCRVDRTEMIEFWVTDNGIGIAGDELPHIFTDFYTTRSPNTRTTDGTGLGLAIVKRLVQAMDGEVFVESRVGRGSTFRFRVPTAEIAIDAERQDTVPALASPTPMTDDTGGAQLRVLLAEDNDISREIISQILRNAGFDVHGVCDGEEALRALELGSYDIIFLDISMPRMDGLETLRRIRTPGASHADVPALALTAHAQEQDRQRFLRAGFNAVLPKPASRAQLLATIREFSRPGSRSQPSPADFDGSYIAEMVDTFGSDKTEVMVDRFEKDVTGTLARLAEILQEKGVCEEFTRLSHQMCGLTALFGANQLEHQFRRLEQVDPNAHASDVTAIIQSARDEAGRVLASMSAQRSSASRSL